MRHSSTLIVSMLLMMPADATAPKATERDPSLELPSPDYLPPLARKLLRKRMERHGRDQYRLVLAVTLLQRQVVKSLATGIAEEPRIVRPIAEGQDDLNAALPERFFVLQDALRLRAKDLANAASKQDDASLAKAFGQLVEVCVGCHSAYLNPTTAP